MKYNKVDIMNKAHSLRKVYNMNMSTALTKAWKMAKVAVLENEKFALDMKDLSGGRNNVVAQVAMRANQSAIERLASEISTLQAQIYPTVSMTQTYDELGDAKRNALQERIARLEAKIAEAKNPIEKFSYERQHSEAKRTLENSIKVYTNTVVDLNAYNAA